MKASSAKPANPNAKKIIIINSLTVNSKNFSIIRFPPSDIQFHNSSPSLSGNLLTLLDL